MASNTAEHSKAGTEIPEAVEEAEGPFFRRIDWLSGLTTLAISLAAYTLTLAPTVTLEDSGELVVAADYLGVPHPPGYPIWTLLAWLFQWIFNFVTYEGQPNPAWAVGFMSAFFGAVSCAALALLISRSGYDMLRGIPAFNQALGSRTEALLCWAGGVSGGLLFAFSPVLWSQSVIVEVYSLNAFFLTLILLLTYRWMCRPHEDMMLYLVAFLFGLGLTNHQSLLFAILGLICAIAFRDIKLFRDVMGVGLWCIAVLLIYKAVTLGGDTPLPEHAAQKTQMIMAAIVLLVAPAGLYFIQFGLLSEWKRAVLLIGLIALGLSFYLYLPISSDMNPPMNWGYPRTEEGFWHALSRGQYEKISVIDNIKEGFADPAYVGSLFYKVVFSPTDFVSVIWQFTWPMILFAIVCFGFIWNSRWDTVSWFIVTLVTFASITFIFLLFQFPDLDVQTLFIGRVQYIQSHAIYALWLAYGLILSLAWLDSRLPGNAGIRYASIALAFALPFSLIYRNAYSQNEDFRKLLGGVEQNGHTFGWQFGNYQLRGVEAIIEELNEGDVPPPSSTYPPEMDPNAIFFGGTDPGRFVPTYMIYSAKVRPDVFLITQNALADNTYMAVMRDLYGDKIWIPATGDSNQAFKQYVEDVRSGRIPAGAAVTEAGGRVSVQGVQGVMMINGILTKYIFDYNKHKHSFYVEESYVIPWMYPHLTPHGLIMKINSDPLPRLPDDVVKDDHAFWTWYTNRLLSNDKFKRDIVARKTFSKLRSAIGGLYVYRRNYAEAEYAFRQAIELYDLSPEANFRLADALVQQRKFDDAIEIIENFLVKDEENLKVAGYLNQLKFTSGRDKRRAELEPKLATGADLKTALELCGIYKDLGQAGQFDNLANRLVSDPRLPVDVLKQIGQQAVPFRRWNIAEKTYQQLTTRAPQDYAAWIELAAVQLAVRKHQESVNSIQKAVVTGGEVARRTLRTDKRFDPVRSAPAFQQLVQTPRAKPGPTSPMNFQLGGQ